jgi:hypothetical protein
MYAWHVPLAQQLVRHHDERCNQRKYFEIFELGHMDQAGMSRIQTPWSRLWTSGSDAS